MELNPSFEKDGKNPGNVALKVQGILMTAWRRLWMILQATYPSFDHRLVRYQALKFAEVGNQIWILYGSSCPVILREEQLDEYSFKCLALAGKNRRQCKIMYGETVDRFEQKNGLHTAMKEIYII
jgi:hypothetical protein